MMIRERIAWCLLALASLLCVAAEAGRERAESELADVRSRLDTLEQRVEEHNKEKIQKFIEAMDKRAEEAPRRPE